MMPEDFLYHRPIRPQVVNTKLIIRGRLMFPTNRLRSQYRLHLLANIRCQPLIYRMVIHLVPGSESRALADKNQALIGVIALSFPPFRTAQEQLLLCRHHWMMAGAITETVTECTRHIRQ